KSAFRVGCRPHPVRRSVARRARRQRHVQSLRGGREAGRRSRRSDRRHPLLARPRLRRVREGEMPDKIDCEIYLAINEDGDYEVATTDGDAAQLLSENSGGAMIRIVRITAKIAPPKATEVTLDVPDEAGETVESEVE